MKKKVLKFGGTSVGSIDRIVHAAKIIKKESELGNQIIVVVSAMAGKTNELIKNAEQLTAENTGITVVIALNYGGRNDIAQAAHVIAARAAKEGVAPSIDEIEGQFSAHLMTAGMVEPDLMIRTSGECRISNFLLWQCSYSELYFSNRLWPDFTKKDLKKAIGDFFNRKRKFGVETG